ncbi:MAG: bifunctional diaminohydroxyphosphoribosylaminopyrimidine deaminase/5-amino-6-(5-phosphoribosylamino)uracil reductase RibD [Myxococcales bacterium]|nr:bifunctional diaminohydroxyphosphoribosylaminopyrimidine deaminase/5-amino-6-(5-phosphoribosylamino)uracil reductase RibD [Myxococcales bacterium]
MMRRALRQALRGKPSPNPRVGAVVARGPELVGLGHHAACGGPHAEAVALARAGKQAKGATLYVTMEPCNHRGRTGPCTELILSARPKRLVVGCADPSGNADGGLERLRAAGIEVVASDLREEARQLIADFDKHARLGLPLVTLKAAITLDGHMATRSGDSKWITGEAARKQAHRLRAEADAIVVGVGTVLADDPALTVRHVRGQDPMRVVLDSRLRTPVGSQVVVSARVTPTVLLHARDAPPRRAKALASSGVELVPVAVARNGHIRVRAALERLAKLGVLRVLAEGGPTVHGALLDAGLVDQVEIFIAPRLLGDAEGRSMLQGRPRRRILDATNLSAVRTRRFGPDILVSGRVE